jgi:hypothetical protein
VPGQTLELSEQPGIIVISILLIRKRDASFAAPRNLGADQLSVEAESGFWGIRGISEV